MELSSKLLQQAVDQLATLPGIGKKTAMRLTLNLLKRSQEDVNAFGNAFIRLREEIVFCKLCHNISDAESCDICTNTSRDQTTICVVEEIKDVIALENTQQYNGLYHVLGGKISPMDGIGPSDLTIDDLLTRVNSGNVKEVILALSTTMEGDTTNFYLFRKLSPTAINVSQLARGMGVGDELEYTDEVTLGRSLLHRMPYEHILKR